MNRIEELNKLPKSKEAIDKLINCIASHRNTVFDDGLSRAIDKLRNRISKGEDY